MLELNLTIQPTEPKDLEHINSLCDFVFGPGRFAKTAFRLREAYNAHDDFGFCVWSGNTLIGSVTFTPIRVNNQPGVYLLGPLVVHPSFAGQGCGVRLVEEGVKVARDKEGELVILVGDVSYYGRMGFSAAPIGRFCFPGPVDAQRILIRELQSGALEKFQGKVHV